MDMNDYVLGNGVVTPEQQRAIAGSLRNRDNMGAIMALSGDRAVAPVGQEYMKSAGQQQNRGLMHNYYQGNLRQSAADLAERKRANDMVNKLGQQRNGILAQASAKQRSYRMIPKNVQDELVGGQALLAGLDQLKGTFTKDMQSTFPGSGSLRETMGRMAPMLSSKGVLEYQGWQRNLEDWYSSARRHKLFGSALTTTEAQRWVKQAINPDATKEQVDFAIDNIKKLLSAQHQAYMQGNKQQYDPEAVEYFGGFDLGEQQEAPAQDDSPDWEVIE